MIESMRVYEAKTFLRSTILNSNVISSNNTLPRGCYQQLDNFGRSYYVFDGCPEGALVSTSIKQRSCLPLAFQAFKSSLVISREKTSFPKSGNSGAAKRGLVTELSQKSKNMMRFKCVNSRLPLISQFCLSYPEQFPNDGRKVQAHFNAFLTRLRGYFKTRSIDFVYLWIKEFQKRGAPHFHLFLSVKRSKELHRYMAKLWNRLAGQSDRVAHYRVHINPKNFIDWDMGNAQYLTKYLEKSDQKLTPEEYKNVGRFWGSSRGIVSPTRDITVKELSEIGFDATQVKQIVRWVGRWHENKLKYAKEEMIAKGKKPINIKSKVRKTSQGLHIFNAADIFRKSVHYILNLPDEIIPFSFQN